MRKKKTTNKKNNDNLKFEHSHDHDRKFRDANSTRGNSTSRVEM